MKWYRVSCSNKCPVCGKPDWCLVTADGSTVICQRVKSDYPVGTKSAGYLHRLKNVWAHPKKSTSPQPSRKPARDWERMADRYVQNMTAKGLNHVARSLRLTESTLQALRVGWDPMNQVSTWPMLDHFGRAIGIRTRLANGSKKAIWGTDGNGLFYVPNRLSSEYLLICEGPSDAGALMDCGFDSALGRPSCSSGTKYIISVVTRLQPSVVVLMPDRDAAGLSGFAALANDLVNSNTISPEKLDAITPPADVNDIRDWKQKCREELAGTITAKLETIKRRNKGTTHDQK